MKQGLVIQDFIDIAQEDIVPWDNIEGSVILFTGGSGMLASYMIRVILYLNDNIFKERAKVICLARSKKKVEAKFADLLDREDLSFIFQDVCDPIKVNGPLDYIIHAASPASPKYFGADPISTIAPNIVGTNNILQLCVQKNIKSFLFISSSEVYGSGVDLGNGISELGYGYLDPLNIRSCYAESKRMGETMCIAYYNQQDVPVKIVRPFHTYGPSVNLDDGRVFADFVKNIIQKENIILNSDGSAKRAFCYITDAVIGFFLVLLKGENGNAYNVGNPSQQTTIINLAHKLVKLFPERDLEVVHKKLHKDEGNNYLKSVVDHNIPDILKISKMGWSPKVTIEDGFNRVINSLL